MKLNDFQISSPQHHTPGTATADSKWSLCLQLGGTQGLLMLNQPDGTRHRMSVEKSFEVSENRTCYQALELICSWNESPECFLDFIACQVRCLGLAISCSQVPIHSIKVTGLNGPTQASPRGIWKVGLGHSCLECSAPRLDVGTASCWTPRFAETSPTMVWWSSPHCPSLGHQCATSLLQGSPLLTC